MTVHSSDSRDSSEKSEAERSYNSDREAVATPVTHMRVVDSRVDNGDSSKVGDSLLSPLSLLRSYAYNECM